MKSIVVLILLGLCSTALAQMPHNWQKVMDFKEAYIASIKNGEILDSLNACLLYTSDAADERSSVDLGGRRIIKKKKRDNTRRMSHIRNKQRI